MADNLTIEQRLTRIERALVVQGILPRETPKAVPPAVHRTVGRDVSVSWTDGLAFGSALFSYDCTVCKKAHRQTTLIHPLSVKSGQYFQIIGPCGNSIEVWLEQKD
jgi:hypothetical protein